MPLHALLLLVSLVTALVVTPISVPFILATVVVNGDGDDDEDNDDADVVMAPNVVGASILPVREKQFASRDMMIPLWFLVLLLLESLSLLQCRPLLLGGSLALTLIFVADANASVVPVRLASSLRMLAVLLLAALLLLLLGSLPNS